MPNASVFDSIIPSLHACHITTCLGSLLVGSSVWLIDMPFTMMTCYEKSAGLLTFCVHVQAGAKVGSPQDRELVAKAVLAACDSAVAKDPEVLQLVLTVSPFSILALRKLNPAGPPQEFPFMSVELRNVGCHAQEAR